VKRLSLPGTDEYTFPVLPSYQDIHPTKKETEVTTLPLIDNQTIVPIGIVSSENQNVIETENCSTSNNILSDPLVFQSKLASFIISSRLPRSSATKLLKLLRSVDNLQCLKSLPIDSRTLLSTPRSGLVNITNIGGGQYIHFGISHGLSHVLKNVASFQNLYALELWFNIDGLPVDKKGKSFWPILCSFLLEFKLTNPFIVGAYFGKKKPYSVQEYLQPFVEELNHLLAHGLTINDITLNIKIKGIIADAPARAFIKQIKGHSGYFACEKCTEEGDYLSGSISFPEGTAQLRTDESFVLRSNEEHHVGMSPLLEISSFGLVSCIPLDYMHLCCLGIMKKILHFMVRGSTVTNSYCSTRLSKDQIEKVNDRMDIVKQWLCRDFARVPQNLNEFNTYKATEFRQIMMYTGPFLFKNIVQHEVYNNFMIFNILMRLLSCKKTVYAQHEYAVALSKHFLSTFCNVYGRGNVSYNVHSIIHLPHDCKKYGVVDSFSSFPFENYLQHVKQIVQPGHAPLVQLYNRIQEEHESKVLPYAPSRQYPFLDGHHLDGPLPDDLENSPVVQYSTLIMSNFTIRVSKINRKSTKKDDCIIISSNTIGIVKNICEINGDIFLCCNMFESILSSYNEPCSSISVGVFECSQLSGKFSLFSIQDVQFKASYFPIRNINDLSVATFYVCALLHTIC